jgi:hypothetical protein
MEQSTSCDANSRSAGQHIPAFTGLEDYHVYKNASWARESRKMSSGAISDSA